MILSQSTNSWRYIAECQRTFKVPDSSDKTKNQIVLAGKKALQLRLLTALPEDPGSITSTQLVAHMSVTTVSEKTTLFTQAYTQVKH